MSHLFRRALAALAVAAVAGLFVSESLADDDQTVRLLQLAGAALLIGTATVAALRVSTTRRRRH